MSETRFIDEELIKQKLADRGYSYHESEVEKRNSKGYRSSITVTLVTRYKAMNQDIITQRDVRSGFGRLRMYPAQGIYTVTDNKTSVAEEIAEELGFRTVSDVLQSLFSSDTMSCFTCIAYDGEIILSIDNNLDDSARMYLRLDNKEAKVPGYLEVAIDHGQSLFKIIRELAAKGWKIKDGKDRKINDWRNLEAGILSTGQEIAQYLKSTKGVKKVNITDNYVSAQYTSDLISVNFSDHDSILQNEVTDPGAPTQEFVEYIATTWNIKRDSEILAELTNLEFAKLTVQAQLTIRVYLVQVSSIYFDKQNPLIINHRQKTVEFESYHLLDTWVTLQSDYLKYALQILDTLGYSLMVVSTADDTERSVDIDMWLDL